jgi:hypothetical protein
MKTRCLHHRRSQELTIGSSAKLTHLYHLPGTDKKKPYLRCTSRSLALSSIELGCSYTFQKMNLFWKNKFCFLLGLVTKTNPRLTEDKRTKSFFPTQCQRKEIDTAWCNVTYLPTRSLIHEPPPIILVESMNLHLLYSNPSNYISIIYNLIYTMIV